MKFVLLTLTDGDEEKRLDLLNKLVPVVRVKLLEENSLEENLVTYSQIKLYAPITQMHTIKTKTQGYNKTDRILYELHTIALNLFGTPLVGGPSYDELVEFVYDIYHLDENADTFTEAVRAYCENVDQYALFNNLSREIERIKFLEENEEIQPEIHCIVVAEISNQDKNTLMETIQSEILDISIEKYNTSDEVTKYIQSAFLVRINNAQN